MFCSVLVCLKYFYKLILLSFLLVFTWTPDIYDWVNEIIDIMAVSASLWLPAFSWKSSSDSLQEEFAPQLSWNNLFVLTVPRNALTQKQACGSGFTACTNWEHVCLEQLSVELLQAAGPVNTTSGRKRRNRHFLLSVPPK